MPHSLLQNNSISQTATLNDTSHTINVLYPNHGSLNNNQVVFGSVQFCSFEVIILSVYIFNFEIDF